MKNIITLALICFSLYNSQAASVTWDGGGVNNNWNTPNNWNPNAIPVAGDDVTFDGAGGGNA
jgi:hypothetical protein